MRTCCGSTARPRTECPSTVTTSSAPLTGYIRRVVIDGQGVVTDFGRKRRLFNGAARQALRLMMDGCEHIGCPVRPTSCQIDHIEEWVRDGGATDLRNGALKCNGQNRAKHRLGITEERDANGTLVQYRADGTPIIPVGRRLRRLRRPGRPVRDRSRHRTRLRLVPGLGPPPPSHAELIAAGWPITASAPPGVTARSSARSNPGSGRRCPPIA